jgi:hypothetical protein
MYALKAINFPLWTAFAVCHRFWQVVFFIFIDFQEPLNFLLYFIDDPFIIEQYVIQLTIVYMFFIDIFVVDF